MWWSDVIWSDVVWSDVVWSDVVRCGVVMSCDIVITAEMAVV